MHRLSLPRTPLVTAIAVAVVVITFSSAPATAQSSDGCSLSPVTLPLFDATPAAVIVATPTMDGPAPVASDEEITTAVETIVACANSTSQADRYAVFTDRYLASLFTSEEPADQPAFERMIATGAMPETGTATLSRVTDIVRRDDGRVDVTMHITGRSGTVTDRVTLAWDDTSDSWLIDAIVSLDPPGTGN
jgi:hypothetical protein